MILKKGDMFNLINNIIAKNGGGLSFTGSIVNVIIANLNNGAGFNNLANVE